MKKVYEQDSEDEWKYCGTFIRFGLAELNWVFWTLIALNERGENKVLF